MQKAFACLVSQMTQILDPIILNANAPTPPYGLQVTESDTGEVASTNLEISVFHENHDGDKENPPSMISDPECPDESKSKSPFDNAECDEKKEMADEEIEQPPTLEGCEDMHDEPPPNLDRWDQQGEADTIEKDSASNCDAEQDNGLNQIGGKKKANSQKKLKR